MAKLLYGQIFVFSFHVFFAFLMLFPTFLETKFWGGGGGVSKKMFVEKQFFLISCFLHVLCYFQYFSFSNADSSVVGGGGVGGGVGINFKGGKGKTFSLFWHEASLG